ncbi:MAG: DinB family protein [Caldilineaceae bacterium]|nr:DinB family protein [Caldilineaceae bacterium]
MEITQQGIEDVLQRLAETPQRIKSATVEVTPAQLTDKAVSKSWSVNEILAHLRACVDVWGETIDRMLAEDDPTLPHISPRTYLRKSDYGKMPFAESWAIFVAERAALLEKLQPLTPEQWSRSATIKERQHTVFSQARRMALHEEGHCAQIEELLGI